MDVPYFIQHRGISGTGSVSPSRGLHGTPSVRQVSSPERNPSIQSSPFHGGSFSLGFASDPSAIMGANSGGQANLGVGDSVKRKRGRPRKYGPDEAASWGHSLASSAPSGSSPLAMVPSGSAPPMPKRGRGRPRGSGKKQSFAIAGERFAGSAGAGFTPHVIEIETGEDILAKVTSFIQQGPRAVCILSANGAVSKADIQLGTSGGIVTYEGLFEILSLSGTSVPSDGGSRGCASKLSISLSNSEGKVIGGIVAGMLIAATLVQITVGSFVRGGSKAKKGKVTQASNPEHHDLPVAADGVSEENVSPPLLPPSMTTSITTMQELSPPTLIDDWPPSRQIDMRNTTNSYIDINHTRR